MKKNKTKLVSLLTIVIIVASSITVLATDIDKNEKDDGDSKLFAIRTNKAIDRESKDFIVSIEYVKNENNSNSLGFPEKTIANEISSGETGNREWSDDPPGTCWQTDCGESCDWTMCDTQCAYSCSGYTCQYGDTCAPLTCAYTCHNSCQGTCEGEHCHGFDPLKLQMAIDAPLYWATTPIMFCP
jgi:hypothetical protein